MASTAENINLQFMEKALAIAYDRMGCTSPNPPVGALIVKNGREISCGGTQACGLSHAEVFALGCCKEDTNHADMYVTLEPCCHYGKTPPCTEAIIRAGIRRVYMPLLDPNPLVAGKGVASLRNAGVDVVFMHEFHQEAYDLYRPFKKYIQYKKPFVMHKSAMTLDGRIATKTGDSKWITSEYSRYLVHKIRAKVDAVIVGKNTFVRDNPSLTVRLESFAPEVFRYFNEYNHEILGRTNYFLTSLLKREIGNYTNPCRILMGIPDSPDPQANFFSDDNYIVFEEKKKLDKLIRSEQSKEILKKINIVPIKEAPPGEKILFIMDDCYKRGFLMLMLEGGAGISGSFYKAEALDQFMYFFSPKVVGDGIPSIRTEGVASMRDSLKLHDLSYIAVKDEILCNGYKEEYTPQTM